MAVFDVRDVAETERVAATVAEGLSGGGVVRLSGDLGAGKTHFVRGLVHALGGDGGLVSSPTYVLLQTYELANGRRLHHLDAYRVGGAGDFDEIGFDELLDDAASGDVVAIEWPERVEAAMPADAVRVTIEHVAAGRRITVGQGR